MRRNRVAVLAIAVLATLTGCADSDEITVLGAETSAPDSTVDGSVPPIDQDELGDADPADHPDAELAPFEEVGPGKCFPGDQILAQRRGHVESGEIEIDGVDFVHPWSQEELDFLKSDQLDWMAANPTSPCLRGLAEFLNHHDYYEVNDVLLKRWNRLNPDDERDSWTFDLSVAEMADYYREAVLAPVPEGGIVVLNHFYDHDDPSVVVFWKKQVLPEHELVWWLKGFEPGNGKNVLKPVTKFMCGNPLLPPGPPPEPPPTVTTEPPPPTATTQPPPTVTTPTTTPGTTTPTTTPGTTTPTTTPDTTPETTPDTTPTTVKNPAEDVNVNPSVPPQVQGPGSTPVGEDPGPATEPVDSDTGCDGSCQDEVDTPTPSTASSSGPGSDTGSPGSGQSGDGSDLPPGGDEGVSDPDPAGTPPTTAPRTGDPGGF